MGEAGFFRGTSTEQDSRFTNKQKKLLASMKFPKNFTKKVDMKKVNLGVIKPWVGKRVQELMGFEDELVVEYVFGLLEEEVFDPRLAQINLTGFLEDNAAVFMKELYNLILSAVESDSGIPALFIEQKKEELRKAKVEEMRIAHRAKELMEKEEKERAKVTTSRFDQEPKLEQEEKKPHRSELVESSSRSKDLPISSPRHHRSHHHEERDRRSYDRDDRPRYRSSHRDEERYSSRYVERGHRDRYEESGRSSRSHVYEESRRYSRSHRYEETPRASRNRHYDEERTGLYYEDDKPSRSRPTSSRHREVSIDKEETERRVPRE